MKARWLMEASMSKSLDRTRHVTAACALGLLVAAGCSSPAPQTPAPAATPAAAPAEGDLGTVKDAFDTDETGGFVPTPKTKEELEAARKAYSPYAGRDVPDARLLRRDPQSHVELG